MIDKRVFNNASLLYIRMLIMICITLINTKLLLNYLGIKDFGIYSLIWGLVLIMGFFNNSITSAVQRFLNIYIAKKDTVQLVNTYSVSIVIFIAIGITLTLALILLKDLMFSKFLNIPTGRLEVANYVFYFMTASFFTNLIGLNFHSSIIAMERFSFYSIITVFEAFLKLCSTLLLIFVNDKLFYYSFFLLFSSCIILTILIMYCRSKIYFCKFVFVYEWVKYKEVLSFVSWNLLGSLGMVASTQGLPLIANVFYGVTINASLNISNQLSSLIGTVTSNFQKAFSPYLMKSFITDIDTDLKIIVLSKISVLFYSIVALPLIFYTDDILQIWLGAIPSYVSGIVKISAVIALFEVLAGPLWMLIQAEGNIKLYQTSVLFVMLLNLPISYFLLLKGFNIYDVWLMLLISNFVLLLFRIYFVSRVFSAHFLLIYSQRLVLPVLFYLLISAFLIFCLSLVEYNFIGLIALNLLSVPILAILAFIFLANSNEKSGIRGLTNTLRNKFL